MRTNPFFYEDNATEIDDLRFSMRADKLYQSRLLANPDPRDPDWPGEPHPPYRDCECDECWQSFHDEEACFRDDVDLYLSRQQH